MARRPPNDGSYRNRPLPPAIGIAGRQVPESRLLEVLRLAREAAERELRERLEYEAAVRAAQEEERRARAEQRAWDKAVLQDRKDKDCKDKVGAISELKAALRHAEHEAGAAQTHIEALRKDRRNMDEEEALGGIRRAKLAHGVIAAGEPGELPLVFDAAAGEEN
ncbi:hypothetical protein T484DRAFT_1887462, partial [Baffinella frigidus]